MPKVNVNGIEMYYEVYGDGAPLFLVRGLGGDCTGWLFFQVPVFSKKYKVVIFDNRGVGRTDKPEGPYSIKMFADDTVGLMNRLGIEKAHVWGQSMGGAIAQRIAIHYPERVRSLILEGTWSKTSEYGKYILEIWGILAERGREALAKGYLPFLFKYQFFNEKPEVIRRTEIRIKETIQPTHAFISQNLACLEHDTSSELSKITCPALILLGEQDIIFPVDEAKLMVQNIPNSELVVLKGVGHLAHMEAPDQTNKVVLDFLEKH